MIEISLAPSRAINLARCSNRKPRRMRPYLNSSPKKRDHRRQLWQFPILVAYSNFSRLILMTNSVISSMFNSFIMQTQLQLPKKSYFSICLIRLSQTAFNPSAVKTNFRITYTISSSSFMTSFSSICLASFQIGVSSGEGVRSGQTWGFSKLILLNS